MTDSKALIERLLDYGDGDYVQNHHDRIEAADRIEALEAENERLREALGLADAALRGANMNMNVVERKVRAALKENTDATSD